MRIYSIHILMLSENMRLAKPNPEKSGSDNRARNIHTQYKSKNIQDRNSTLDEAERILKNRIPQVVHVPLHELKVS